MQTDDLLSPITLKNSVALFDTITTKDIIHLYKKQLGFDVSRFFQNIEEVKIYTCTTTGYKFYYPFDLAGDAEFYEDLQKIKTSIAGDYYRHWEYDHQFAFSKINKGDKVLEIGCGSGTFLEKLKVKTNELFGLELNKEAVRICQTKNLDVYDELIENHAESNKETYDVVCAFQVLEHVANVKQFIDSAIKVLKPGGKLIFGVPNNEPYYQRYDKYATLNLPPHHMGMWSKTAFHNLEKVFPIQLTDFTYDLPGRWRADAYLKAKLWLNIKVMAENLTIIDKIKLIGLAPFSVPLSLLKHYSKEGIPGCYIVGLFIKK